MQINKLTGFICLTQSFNGNKIKNNIEDKYVYETKELCVMYSLAKYAKGDIKAYKNDAFEFHVVEIAEGIVLNWFFFMDDFNFVNVNHLFRHNPDLKPDIQREIDNTYLQER